jgi:hypothetical protein
MGLRYRTLNEVHPRWAAPAWLSTWTKRVAARDDLHLLPLARQSVVRLHRRSGIRVHDANAILLAGNKFYQTTWQVDDPDVSNEKVDHAPSCRDFTGPAIATRVCRN